MADHGGLTEALAAVQAKLPKITKGETAKVRTKAGDSYSYSYADLATISAIVLPMLGTEGLAWITKPTLTAEGTFVLHYKLSHTSGEYEDGDYPLPGQAQRTPQEIGSAITYARRYCLCSITGVAPDDDDDGAAASKPVPERQRVERPSEEVARRTAQPVAPEPKAEHIPTSPIGWRNLVERRGVELDTLREAFGHDDAIVGALNTERWNLAVKALPGDKQHELFEFIVTDEAPDHETD